MVAEPLKIALAGHDRVLDLFATLVDPVRRPDLFSSRWDDLWPREGRSEALAGLFGPDSQLSATVSYLDEDASAECSTLISETPLDWDDISGRMPRLRNVVQFGRFAPEILPSDIDQVSVRVFERRSIKHVAEHAIAMVLCLLRDLAVADAAVRDLAAPRPSTDYAYNWAQVRPRALADRRVCVLGFGQVGQAVWRRLEGFGPAGMCYWTRRPNALAMSAHVADLGDALRQSDIVIITLPLTAETRGLIGADAIHQLGEDGILVNVSRGAIVDEPVLVRALQNGSLAAAGLDVFEAEPMPDGRPLREVRNSLLSPHCAGGPVLDLAGELVELLRLCHAWSGRVA